MDAPQQTQSSSSSSSSSSSPLQNVVVMRHGDRIDAFEPLWAPKADRPWDPPLTEGGKVRAWATGKKLRAVGFPIHRVVVSPFLRCLQTAREVVAALCATGPEEALLIAETSQHAIIDPSRVKVHIEFGLCEVLNSQAMRITEPAKDEKWFPDTSELEAIFPAGSLDPSAERIYQQLAKWEEPLDVARDRYGTIMTALADKFPRENLLLVTHGEAVGVSVSSFAKGLEVFNVEYCALSFLQRRVSISDPQAVTAENFVVLTESAKSGVFYYSEEEQKQTDTISAS